MKFFSSIAVVFTLWLAGCTKKSDPPPPNKTDHITASAWTYESAGIDADKNGTIDFALPANTFAACQLDNSISFKANNTGITDEGATKCNASDPQTSNFNWSFTDNETNLQVSGNSFAALNGKFKIQTLNATNFSLSRDTVYASQNVAIILNLKH